MHVWFVFFNKYSKELQMLSLPNDSLNNIFLSLACFIIRLGYRILMIHKICVN